MARTLSAAGVVAVLGSAAVFLAASPVQHGEAAATTALAGSNAEVARIQEHLLGAERVLLARDVSQLTPEQRAARARNVGLLRGYRERGEFPRNIDFPGQREPYFVDDRGVLCAMAYLIAESGRHDIVEHVRATRNNARIHELADEPELLTWLDEAGLTVDEAARIQPGYDGGTCFCPGPEPAPTVSSGRKDYARVTAAATLLNAGAVAWNVRGRSTAQPSAWRGVAAIVTGSAGMLLAAGDPRVERDPPFHAWNAAFGAVTAAAGARTLVLRRRASVSRDNSAEDISVALSPDRGRGPVDVRFAVGPDATAGATVGLGITF